MLCSISKAIQIVPGTAADFAALAHFHYRSHHPGAVTRIFAARHRAGGAFNEDRLAGVLVESLPALGCTLRNIATRNRYLISNRSLAAALLNREVRTISRVVVHPQYRGLGLAVEMVKHALAGAQTPYVEALAAMGRVHPFFQQAGMTAYDRPADARTLRLHAALESAGILPAQLCDQAACLELIENLAAAQRAFLECELHRFAGAKIQHLPLHKPERRDVLEKLLAHTRGHLFSQPVYYLWRKV